MRAAFEIEEAQQQIDHGRLAGAGAADQADLFARMNRQVEILRARRRRGRSRNCTFLKSMRPSRTVSGRASAGSSELQRLRDGDHALLHDADILEDFGDAAWRSGATCW